MDDHCRRTSKALQRVGMFLMRRGFDPAVARSAIRARIAADGEVDELPDAEDQVASDG